MLHAALLLGVPVKTFKKYARENEAKKRALELIKENRYGTTYEYSEDMNELVLTITHIVFHIKISITCKLDLF